MQCNRYNKTFSINSWYNYNINSNSYSSHWTHISHYQGPESRRYEKREERAMVCGRAPNFQSVITHDIRHVTQALLSLKVHFAPYHDESLGSGRVLRGIWVLCGGPAADGGGDHRDHRQRALHPPVLLQRQEDQHLPLPDGEPGLGGLPLPLLLPLRVRGNNYLWFLYFAQTLY